jgi:hypothetical protein
LRREIGTSLVANRLLVMTERKPKDNPKPPRDAQLPPEVRPDLIDPEKTPGTGMLPEPHDPNPSPSG